MKKLSIRIAIIFFIQALFFINLSAQTSQEPINRWNSPSVYDRQGTLSHNGEVVVNPSSGGLSSSAVDLQLNGINGFNFPIKRYYTSQQAIFDHIENEKNLTGEDPKKFDKSYNAYSFGAGWRLDLPLLKTSSDSSSSGRSDLGTIKAVILPGGGVMNLDECKRDWISADRIRYYDGRSGYVFMSRLNAEGKRYHYLQSYDGTRYMFDSYSEISIFNNVFSINYGITTRIISPDFKNTITIEYHIPDNSDASDRGLITVYGASKNIQISKITDSLGTEYHFSYLTDYRHNLTAINQIRVYRGNEEVFALNYDYFKTLAPLLKNVALTNKMETGEPSQTLVSYDYAQIQNPGGFYSRYVASRLAKHSYTAKDNVIFKPNDDGSIYIRSNDHFRLRDSYISYQYNLGTLYLLKKQDISNGLTTIIEWDTPKVDVPESIIEKTFDITFAAEDMIAMTEMIMSNRGVYVGHYERSYITVDRVHTYTGSTDPFMPEMSQLATHVDVSGQDYLEWGNPNLSDVQWYDWSFDNRTVYSRWDWEAGDSTYIVESYGSKERPSSLLKIDGDCPHEKLSITLRNSLYYNKRSVCKYRSGGFEDGNTITTTYDYDIRRDLTRASGTVLESPNYYWESVLRTKTINTGSWVEKKTYTYRLNSQEIKERLQPYYTMTHFTRGPHSGLRRFQDFRYDNFGNIVASTIEDTTIQKDINGNTIKRVDGTNVSTVYAHDVEKAGEAYRELPSEMTKGGKVFHNNTANFNRFSNLLNKPVLKRVNQFVKIPDSQGKVKRHQGDISRTYFAYDSSNGQVTGVAKARYKDGRVLSSASDYHINTFKYHNETGLLLRTVAPNGTVKRYQYSDNYLMPNSSGSFLGEEYTVTSLIDYLVDPESGEREILENVTTCDLLTGLPTSSKNGELVKHQTYDPFFRLESQTVPSPEGDDSLVTSYRHYIENPETKELYIDAYQVTPDGNYLHKVSHFKSGRLLDVYKNLSYSSTFPGVRQGTEILRNEYDGMGRVLRRYYQPIEEGRTQYFSNFIYSENGRIGRIDTWDENEDNFESIIYTYGEGGPFNVDIHKEVNGVLVGGTNRSVYSSNGRLIEKITDLGGLNLRTTYYYDSSGRLNKIVDPERNSDTGGSSDPKGNIRSIVYDAIGRVRLLTLNDEPETFYVENSGSIESYKGSAINYSGYDAFNRVVRQDLRLVDDMWYSYRRLMTTHYNYDGLNRIVERSSLASFMNGSEDLSVRMNYDRFGNIESLTDPMGRIIKTEYNQKTGVIEGVYFSSEEEGPEKRLSGYDYDAWGNVLESYGPLHYSEDSSFYESEAVYNSHVDFDYFHNMPSEVTLPHFIDENESAGVMRREYYDNGLLKGIKSPEGQATYYIYNDKGQVQFLAKDSAELSKLDQNWLEEYSYDGLNRVDTVKRRDGSWTSYTYDNANRITQTVDSLGGCTRLFYDNNGNVVETRRYKDGEHSQDVITKMTYNALGWCTKVTESGDATEASEVRRTEYGYDAWGRVTYTKDPRGNKTFFFYNEIGLLMRQVDNVGETVYDYDKSGNMIYMKDKVGTEYVMSYTPESLLEKQVITPVNGDVITISNLYDAAGNLQRVRQDSGDVQIQQQYNYTENKGRTYLPDPLGRIRKQGAVLYIGGSVQRNLITLFDYDLDGKLTKIKYPNYITVHYDYDSNGRLSSVSGLVDSIFYDDSDDEGNPGTLLLDEVQYFNGTVQSFRYDHGLVKSDILSNIQNFNSPTLSRFYGYDSLGNITDIDSTFSRRNYNYNDFGELSNVDMVMTNWIQPIRHTADGDVLSDSVNVYKKASLSSVFEYDLGGNLIAQDFSIDYDNGVSSNSFIGQNFDVMVNHSFQMEHDNNMISSTTLMDGSPEYNEMGSLLGDDSGYFNRYDFDAMQKLIAINNEDEGTELFRNYYTPDGLRIAKENSQTGEMDFYSYLGNSLLYEEDSNGNYTQYIYVNGKLGGYRTGNRSNPATRETFVARTDHLGSVEFSLNASGQVVSGIEYSEYGEVLRTYGNDPLRIWAGKKYDEDFDLYYFNQRWYDQGMSRFITEDPIKDGLNWYSYCGNDPVNNIDPSGLEEEKPTIEQLTVWYGGQGVSGIGGSGIDDEGNVGGGDTFRDNGIYNYAFGGDEFSALPYCDDPTAFNFGDDDDDNYISDYEDDPNNEFELGDVVYNNCENNIEEDPPYDNLGEQFIYGLSLSWDGFKDGMSGVPDVLEESWEITKREMGNFNQNLTNDIEKNEDEIKFASREVVVVIAGDVVDWYEAGTGSQLITGIKLTPAEHKKTKFAAAAPFISGLMLNRITRWARKTNLSNSKMGRLALTMMDANAGDLSAQDKITRLDNGIKKQNMQQYIYPKKGRTPLRPGSGRESGMSLIETDVPPAWAPQDLKPKDKGYLKAFEKSWNAFFGLD